MAKEKNSGAIENILGDTLQIWGTCWEPDENTLGTKIIPFPLLPQETQKKKLSPHETSHWLHEISLSKTIHHYFLPELIPLLKNWYTYSGL